MWLCLCFLSYFFKTFLVFDTSFFIISGFSFISSTLGTRKANETITAIGTANRTPKNHIIVPHNIIHKKTTKGLTHNVFHIIIGTNNFSSDCWIIVYRIMTARNHHHPEKIKADIAAGNHHKNGQIYGIISNKPANIARVHF
jgi:hypothetical protein